MKVSLPNGDRDESQIPNTPLPFFIANHAALDFLNSTAPTAETILDWLGSGKALLEWLVQAKLIGAGQAAAVRASCSPRELDEAAAQARALRDWFRGFVLSHMGRRLSAKAVNSLQPLNRVLEHDEKYWAIVQRSADSKNHRQDSGLERRSLRRCCTANALVLPIAQAMADLVCLEDFSMVKSCGGNHSSLLFLDRTQTRAVA
jgi:predicted RNA-binding Zn ribbon-like protein